jgi:hypothetical protein
METDRRRLEAERQLAEAAVRHQELVASLAQRGRSDAADASAIRAVSRGVQLVSYALVHARAAGVGS